MRRWLIRAILPLLLCCLLPLGAVLVFFALPPLARGFYLEHVTPLDTLMLILGISLFLIQFLLAWRALQWRQTGFDEGPDSWLTHLAQAAEWFPLLGLIGTVTSIMTTFAGFGPDRQVPQTEVIRNFAPAITATCTGLMMALLNILPTWMVLLGRDLILTLAGGPPPASPLAPLASRSDQEPAQR